MKSQAFVARAAILVFVAYAGCAADESAPFDPGIGDDASVDEAPAVDGGYFPEVPDEIDASVVLDSGVVVDAGTIVDAGSMIRDAGAPTIDAGTPSVDAGMPMPTLPSLRPRRFRIADPAVEMAPCRANGTGSVRSSTVLLGQTHLVPQDSPFLAVSADRPLTIGLSVAGSGNAPAMTATATNGGTTVGTICLAGPSSLPAASSDLRTNTYRASFPAAWVRPGLSVTVRIGTSQVASFAVRVHAANALSLVLLDAVLFGQGIPDPAIDRPMTELLARLPTSYLDVSYDPFGAWRPTKLLIEARSDGTTPTGATTSHGPIVVDRNPHCTSADKAAGTCTLHSGYGTMAGVLDALDTFSDANGIRDASTWYADLAIALGGGLAGGQRGTGDNRALVMNHELGHAWGFPHWAASHTDYPYRGESKDNGGFGERWGFDVTTNALWSPRCGSSERQSPMQRSGTCLEPGATLDPYSDYEAMRLLRMTLGAERLTGTIPYRGTDVAYVLPAESGRRALRWRSGASGFAVERYDAASNGFVAAESTKWNAIDQREVAVRMFSGAVIHGGASFLDTPVDYVGNTLRDFDPSKTETMAFMQANKSTFYWAHDLNLRFTLSDGTSFYRLLPGVLAANGDAIGFAVNLPLALGRRVTRIDVVSRPLGQWSSASALTSSDTAANFYSRAVVVASFRL